MSTTTFDPKAFPVYCRKDSCGERFTNLFGETYYTKRPMNYAGISFWVGTLIYLCPVCGGVRRFSYNGRCISEE